VRVLVQTREARGRLAMAASGLALRGHVVGGSGGGEPEAPAQLWRVRAEVVATDEARPLRSAFRGALAGARCLVAALSYDAVSRWGTAEHWAWSTLSPLGLVEPSEAPAFQAAPRGLALDRLGLWSDEAPPAEPDPAHPDVEVLERACERAIARHRSRALRPAAFLDRDGTLVPDTGYMGDPNDLELFPGTAEALRTIAAAGYALVVISNQAGVGRGLFGLTRAYEVMARLRSLLREAGVELDAVYLCPHRPDEGCECRKPRTALLERAADDLGLSLRRSVMVGDKWIDVEAAHRVGAVGVLVRTGYGREEETHPIPGWRLADEVLDDLPAFARWLSQRPVHD
jgi:D-glycero-D-manno-heptose 1,7-bisphosphate phosphatase